MKKTFLVVLVFFVGLVVSGLWLSLNKKNTNPIYRSPQNSLIVVLSAFESGDVSSVEEVVTAKAFQQLEELTKDEEWKNSALFLKSEQWKLKSNDIWPILAKWASKVKNQSLVWLRYSISNKDMYPVFKNDESLYLIFEEQRNGDWKVARIVSSLAR